MAAVDNRESITAIEAVKAAGDVIDLILIIQGSQMLERYFPDLPDRYGVTPSSSISKTTLTGTRNLFLCATFCAT